MTQFLEKYSKWLRYTSLVTLLIVPFLLYFAALSASSLAVNLLLALMGLCMGLILKIG